jgi:hypothetical protein
MVTWLVRDRCTLPSIYHSSHAPPHPTLLLTAVGHHRRQGLRSIPLCQPASWWAVRPRRQCSCGPGRDRGVLWSSSTRGTRATAVRASPDWGPPWRAERHHRPSRWRSQQCALRRADIPHQGIPQPVLHRGTCAMPAGFLEPFFSECCSLSGVLLGV